MEFPKSNYRYGEHNTLSEIICPPVKFWPVYCCIIKGIVSREEFAKSLDTMAARGIRGLYLYSLTNAFGSESEINEYAYLSDSYMRMIADFVEEAEARGINLWMYDEAGWPSGAADGLVVKKFPHLAALAINKHGEKSLITPLAQPYPDLMDPRSTEAFIQLTHERYKSYFGNYGAHFPLTFTDEPEIRTHGAPDTIPWSEGFEEKFRAAFGYDISEYLPLLFEDSPCDEKARKVRGDYHDLVSRLFVEGYFIPIRDFCRKNGSLATGHVAGDDVAIGNARWGYHHILRCLRAMDVPGVDMIWRQVFPGPQMPGIQAYAPLCANSFFPRYASSAAHQTGARLSMTESYAIYGGGLTHDQMRWLYNFQVVRGLNLLNPMNTCMQYGGRHYAGGTLRFCPDIPGSSDLSGFNLWAARASYVMSAGKPVIDAALYMPMYDIWPGDKVARDAAELFESLGSQLERRGCDIDVIDDDVILAAEISGNAMLLGDAQYRILYMQPNITIPDDVKAKLLIFQQAGGKVVVCTGDFSVDPIILSDGDLRATRRRIPKGTIYYVTNEAFDARSGEASFPRETVTLAWEIDLLTGHRKIVSVAPYRYEMGFGSERVILFPEERIEGAPVQTKKPENTLTLTDFKIRKLNTFVITENGPFKESVNEDYQKITLGDWRSQMGEFFSGDCMYRTVFHADEAMRSTGAVLDLGAVNYSCEVFLNGKSLGVGIFSPFVFSLPELQEENELCIRVSNSICNAQEDAHYDELFPGWKPDHLTSIMFGFQKDSLVSGLFGPVTLHY